MTVNSRRAIAALLVLAVGGEAALRLRGVRYRFPSPCTLVDGRGCLLVPGSSEVIAADGAEFRFTTNSLGLRSREPVPEDAARRRVVVLGDSIAFGALVNDDEVFTARLDAALASRGIAVINTASPYLKGTEQQLRFLIDERDALRPNLVLVVFTTRNDFADNKRHDFFLEGVPQPWRPRPMQRLVKASEHMPGYQFLTNHSWLFGLFSYQVWNVAARFSEAPGSESEATESVLRLLQSDCRAHGVALAVVMFPKPPGRNQGSSAEISKEKMLTEITGQLGIPLFDASPIIAVPDAMNRAGHLSPSGHRALAEALEPRIVDWLRSAR